MSPEGRIAVRFLLSRKRSVTMSVLGIAFGVAFFVLTQAQTTGFERFYIQTILGTSGAIQVQDRFQDTLRSMEAEGEESGSGFRIAHRRARQYVEGVEHPEAVAVALREFENVAGVSEVVSGAVQLRTSFRRESCFAMGIRMEDHLAVSNLGQQIVWGSARAFREAPQGVLVGRILAQRMALQVGDSFFLETVEESRRYRVAGIYETGVREIDESRVYLHLTEARSLLGRPWGASFLQVSLRDPGRARADAARMEETIGHFAYSWQERERAWLEVFRALRVSSGLTVATIILISGLGMFNTLAMMVMEKTREISILRSMGYTRGNVMSIFAWQGGIVLGLGILAGWIGGGLFTYGVSRIPIRIRGIFATDHFVVHWSWSHYLWGAAIAAVVVAVATWLPARQAARLEPVEALRGI